MPTLPLPFFGKVNRNVDAMELSADTESLIDAFVDARGFTRKRPGVSTLADLGAGTNQRVEGMYWWADRGYVIAVAGGRTYKITYSNGTATVTDLTTIELSANQPVSFATDGTYLFMADGGRVVYTDGTNTTGYIADADCPTTVTHVAYLDGYLLVNDAGTNQWQYSNVNDSLTWDATDFFSASGDADHVRAIRVLNREIFLFGDESFEIWENDGTSPFVRIPGGFREWGCVAPYSIVEIDDGLVWLDNERHFRTYGGSQSQIISTPYDREIEQFSTVSDCVGMVVEISGQRFLVFRFTAESRTLVYNIVQQDWSEWCLWSSADAEYTRWIGQSYVRAVDWGVHLVGSRFDSIVYTFSEDNYDDDGTEIRVKRLTGSIDHEILKRKRSEEIRLRIKRGAVNLSTTPKVVIRWRDNNGNWSNEHELSLKAIGNTDFIARIQRSGVYRARQFEIVATDSAPIIFGEAEEDFEVLR